MSGCPFKTFFASFQESSQSKDSEQKPTGTNLFLDYALAKCPFLHNVEVKQGYEKACQFFSGPWKPKTCQEQSTIVTAFQTFHGAGGVVPLDVSQIPTPTAVTTAATETCKPTEVEFPNTKSLLTSSTTPVSVSAGLQCSSKVQPSLQVSVRLRRKRAVKQSQNSSYKQSHNSSYNSLYYGGNFASLSLSGGWGFFKLGQMKKLRKKIKSKGKGSSGKSNQNSGQQSKARSIKRTSNTPSACPLRSALGPLAGAVFNEAGKLTCPAPIVAMRATLSKTTFIKELRPKSLPTKLATIGGIGVLANIPCGMIREHYKKFSTGWFVSVHATIPFVAMLRKAAILPKYALGVTIIAAIVGQAIGAKIEKQRILEGKSWVKFEVAQSVEQTDSQVCSHQIEVMA